MGEGGAQETLHHHRSPEWGTPILPATLPKYLAHSSQNTTHHSHITHQETSCLSHFSNLEVGSEQGAVSGERKRSCRTPGSTRVPRDVSATAAAAATTVADHAAHWGHVDPVMGTPTAPKPGTDSLPLTLQVWGSPVQRPPNLTPQDPWFLSFWVPRSPN